MTGNQVKQRWKCPRISWRVCTPFAVQVKGPAPCAIGRAAIDIQRYLTCLAHGRAARVQRRRTCAHERRHACRSRARPEILCSPPGRWRRSRSSRFLAASVWSTATHEPPLRHRERLMGFSGLWDQDWWPPVSDCTTVRVPHISMRRSASCCGSCHFESNLHTLLVPCARLCTSRVLCS